MKLYSNASSMKIWLDEPENVGRKISSRTNFIQHPPAQLLSFFYKFNKLSNASNISLNCSHKKRKDSLEGNLDRVLFTVELEFPKILVSQHTSNVNTECTGKSKHLYWLCYQILRALIYFSFFYSDINLFLIDDAWCKLCNIWLLLCESNSKSITMKELNTEGKILLQLLLK